MPGWSHIEDRNSWSLKLTRYHRKAFEESDERDNSKEFVIEISEELLGYWTFGKFRWVPSSLVDAFNSFVSFFS